MFLCKKRSWSVKSQVDETEKKINVLSENDKEEKRNCVAEAFHEAPKVLACTFETVAGAIYRDSGDQIEIVWKIYVPLMKEAFDILWKYRYDKNFVIPLLKMKPNNLIIPDAFICNIFQNNDSL